jgi:beta-1,4-mannosyltransferase
MHDDTDTFVLDWQAWERELDAGRVARQETNHHRLTVSVLLGVALVLLFGVQELIWPHNAHSHGWFGTLWTWLGLIWCVAILPAVLELIGLYQFKAPSKRPIQTDKFVVWRYVSRGTNKDALNASIAACRLQMKDCPLFSYTIEVVVDSNADLNGLTPPGRDLHYIVVPKDYQTPNDSRAKARALHYALTVSPVVPHAWIMHMDEESHPTRSVIIGMANAMVEEDRDNPDNPKVGQGIINYHRNWGEHPFFTLADCIRSGSDKGKLYFSMKLGLPLFGLHGSFVLIRNDMEQRRGFDVGPIGSMTEDAWWGAMASDEGVRTRWVEGQVSEQCTERAKDFLKQRRRWFNGLHRTAFHAPAKFRYRFILLISCIAWASAPFAWVYTFAHIVEGGYTSPVIRILANFSLAVYVTTTLVGLQLNLKEHGITQLRTKIRWAFQWLVFLPICSGLEALAVGYAIIQPARSFEVVRK